MLRDLRNKSLLRYVFSIVLAGFLLFLLLSWVNPNAILDLILAAEPRYLLVAFVLYSSVYLSRSLRIKQFAALAHVSVWALFPIIALHGFFNFILPLRTGEATLVYLLRRYQRIVLGSSLGVLIVARIFDLSSLAICFAAGLVVRNVMQASPGSWLLVGVSVLICFGLVVLTMTGARIWNGLRRLFFRFLRRLGVENRNWSRFLLRLIDDVSIIFEDAKSPSLSVRLLLTSILMWLCLFATFWMLLRTMGILDFNFIEVMIGSTGAALSNALPINAVGSIGTLELGWMAGYSLLGMSVEQGVASGFAIHIWTMLFSALWAGIAYFILTIVPGEEAVR